MAGRFYFGLVRRVMCAGVGAALIVASGCKSTSTNSGAITNSGSMSRPDSSTFNPTSASLCLQRMIANPPVPLHLSFAETSTNNHASSIEADITPETVNYTRRESNDGQTTTTTKHLAHAQMSEMELDYAVMGPVPWHGELVAAKDAAKSTSEQNTNGYSTLKYSIDTADEPASQKAAFDSLMAVRDYKIVGNAWVARDTGCLVKYSIDFEQDKKDGGVEKTHFEGNVTKQ